MVFNKSEYHKEWYLNNIEHIKEQQKEYRLNNLEHVKEQQKKYYENNLEKIKQHQLEYNQSENGKKSYRISKWKQTGIITDDYEFLYEWYMGIDNCLNCNIKLINGKGATNHKHLDHDHTTGEPCIVVCGNCNINILK